MDAGSDNKLDMPRFQFRMRTLLAVMTAACILLACLPRDMSAEMRLGLFAYIALMASFAAWIVYQARRRQYTPPEDVVTVKIDAKWLRRVKSPFIIGPIAALTGVSVTGAPAFLFWCGQIDELGVLGWIGVIASFLMIYFVPGFYMSLASEVLAQLVPMEAPTVASTETPAPSAAASPRREAK